MLDIKIFRDNNLPEARMISLSKSEYRDSNPHSVCIFNANVITAKDGKIWYGDLDLTKDANALKAVSKELGVILYVLRESDARFENEDKGGVELIQKAVWDTTQDIPFK